MHEAEGAAHGIDYNYRLIDMVEKSPVDLGALLAEIEAEGFAGVNVTHPFKQQVLCHVTERAPEVERVGACNTVLFEAGGRRAHNTDYLGFLHGFRTELGAVPHDLVLLLGAGGAGRAVGLALAEAGVADLRIHDSNEAAADRLAGDVRRLFPKIRAASIEPSMLAELTPDGIVNATPVGMAAHPGMPIDRCLLENRPWVADIVYFPLETELLEAARGLGCITMSGRGMAVMQAVKAFELFTGVAADPDRMAETFDSFDSRGHAR